MNTTLRRSTITVAAVAATGVVALSAPGMAQGLQQVINAHKVDGLHAKELTKTQYFAAQTTFDNFNTCAFSPVLTKTFKSPHAGVVSVVSSVNAARDTDNPNEGILTTRVTLDGTPVTAPASANLENNGTLDSTVTAIGAIKTGKGNHTVVIEAKECGTGQAFITSQSMTVSYSPFGSVVTPPSARLAVGGTNR